MEKYTGYIVLYGFSKNIPEACSQLSKNVQQYLENGWHLQGGVSISVSKYSITDFYTVAQAMVKVEKE